MSIDVGTGFPSCTRSNNYTIVGNTDVSVLQSDGSLIVDGISLRSSQYCVERIKELDGKSKVFVCPEYAPQRYCIKSFTYVKYSTPNRLLLNSAPSDLA